jgi:hypothetical protein
MCLAVIILPWISPSLIRDGGCQATTILEHLFARVRGCVPRFETWQDAPECCFGTPQVSRLQSRECVTAVCAWGCRQARITSSCSFDASARWRHEVLDPVRLEVVQGWCDVSLEVVQGWSDAGRTVQPLTGSVTKLVRVPCPSCCKSAGPLKI